MSASGNETALARQEPRRAVKTKPVAPRAAAPFMTSGRRLLVRKILAHSVLLAFLAVVLIPFVMVVSASFRQGNFAPSRLLPDKVSLDHWKFVLGIPYQEIVNPATGETRMIKPSVPPLLWFWNSIKISFIASTGIILVRSPA